MIRLLTLFFAIWLLLFCGCKSPSVSEKMTPPFIGIRHYETRPGVSGTGTPQRQVEIKENGDVVFSFIQINQADKITETKGSCHAGKFKKVLKCVFKEWDNETSFYEITKDVIYETDSLGVRLKSDECCGTFDAMEGELTCPCECEYFELIK